MPKSKQTPKNQRAFNAQLPWTHEVNAGAAIALLFQHARPDHLTMTLRIEKVPHGPSTTLRLIGRMRAELLEELNTQIKASGTKVILDLEEVSLVDVDVVRFLGASQAEGVSLIHCSPYINDWIARERGRDSLDSESR